MNRRMAPARPRPNRALIRAATPAAAAAATAAALLVAAAAVLAAAAPSVSAGAQLWPGDPAPAAPSRTAAANLMHPLVPLLDAEGRLVLHSGSPVSADRTCGACHDASFINGHSTHWTGRTRVSCVECHLQEGRLPEAPASLDAEGRLRREFLRISAPRDQNCARCHGLVHTGAEPLRLCGDDDAGGAGLDGLACDLTWRTGAVVSAQDLAGSFLNLAGKEKRNYPWDVHARRQVGCIACHFAPNSPAHRAVKDSSLAVLVNDPRRASVAEYLRQPDHRLAAAECRHCHDPMQAHAFLPYRARHLDVLACEACHIPWLAGPAARAIDATVVDEKGAPLVEYRGVDRRDGEPLGAALLEGFTPLLLPARQTDGRTRLAPYNAVERWCWTDGPGGPEVPPPLVRAAHRASGDGSEPRPSAAASPRPDIQARRETIRARLAALGVGDPRLRREVALHRVRHGVLAGPQVERDCAACHTGRSRLSAALALGGGLPGRADPGLPLVPVVVSGTSRTDAAAAGVWARLESVDDTLLVRAGTAGLARFYILGHSRHGWSDRLGFGIFLAAILGSAAHGLLRVLSGRRRSPHRPPVHRAYLYTAYERAWHWLMAISIIVLMGTGISIHAPGGPPILPLPVAVAVHNAVALILLVNGFLSLFYHVTTSAIRQFLPARRGLTRRLAAQARFYTRGIFLGQPHPSPRTVERKLNPLQQLTYLALLNVLFPLQAATGTLMWGASRWPAVADLTGGLTLVAPLHNLGSWLFLSFFVLHLYLTTTGHTVLSNIKAMVDGWDEVDTAPQAETGGSHA